MSSNQAVSSVAARKGRAGIMYNVKSEHVSRGFLCMERERVRKRRLKSLRAKVLKTTDGDSVKGVLP
jgi:hypothetical protein